MKCVKLLVAKSFPRFFTSHIPRYNVHIIVCQKQPGQSKLSFELSLFNKLDG